MTVNPVLIPIPGNDRGVAPRERIARQRDAAARALDESARLSGLPLLAWRRDEAGVPIFERGVCWSMSHKPACACGVVSTAPVGIDVEIVEPRNEGLWGYVATVEEQARAGPRDWETFFRFWTAKEAVLKMHRVGLARLESCRVVEGPDACGALLTFDASPCRVWFHRTGYVLAALAGPSVAPIWDLHSG